MNMRVAIIGSGVSGLVAGWKLHRDRDVTMFEAGDYIGGHTNTVAVEWLGGRPHRSAHDAPGSVAVDTGFIVHNPRNYPALCAIFAELGVATRDTTMSFAVSCNRSGVEWAGTNLNTVFAQRRNLLSPGFWNMIRGMMRFNDRARTHLLSSGEELPLGEFLARERISARAIEHYILPMGAAIWSAPPQQMLAFPARRFAQFLHNHGMLQTGDDRPVWRTVVGGSRRYVQAITAGWRDRIRLNTPVRAVCRNTDSVSVITANGSESFDRVIMACHSDQALRLLEQPTLVERAVLGSFPYQRNPAVLHDDVGLMPRRRRAWSAWNYAVEPGNSAVVSYWMNRLQGLQTPSDLVVTLNARAAIAPQHTIYETVYEHPLFNATSPTAQLRRSEISGAARVHYCGAYWGHGFHEDGAVSGLAVAKELAA